MLTEPIQQLVERLDSLTRNLTDSESINKMLAGPSSAPHLKSTLIERRLHTYFGAITLTYSAFEQYVESLVIAYLDSLARIVPRFDQLPAAIVDNHGTASAALLMNLERDKYLHRTSECDVARNIASCYGDDYCLNALAYIEHRANLRSNALNLLLREVGVGDLCKRVLAHQPFRSEAEQSFPGQDLERVPLERLLRRLDELVERRNAVAHSWPDEILSVDLMSDVIRYVQLLCEALRHALLTSLWEYEIEHSCIGLPPAINIIDRRIVCLELSGLSISVGDRVLVRHPNKGLFEVEIKCIQLNQSSLESIAVHEPTSVGIELSKRVSKGCTLHYPSKVRGQGNPFAQQRSHLGPALPPAVCA